MNYEEAINYLKNLTKFGMNFGLGRITELMRRLGDPQDKLNVIHLGGTNGKGSTGTMIASILREAGYKTGIFTSPHLHSYTERYRINGKEIAKEDVAGLIEKLKPHLDEMVSAGFEHPTEFEVSTALAFCYFYEQDVDLLILEVGLGGEIDSTNVISAPLVSVLTNVAMDHMDYLGNNKRDIAKVKAGIIKENRPVVTAAREHEVLEVIREKCKQMNSPLIEVGRDITWKQTGVLSTKGQYLDVKGRFQEYKDLWLPLLGLHQLENAALAVAVTEVLEEKGLNVTQSDIRAGLSSIYWPARLEIVNDNPLILVDVAHNYEGAKSLRRALDDYFSGYRVVLVMGMLGDKERERVVSELAPRARAAIITKPNSPRAGDWQQLAEEIRPLVSKVKVVEDIKGAVNKGIDIAEVGEMICITGSFYMVAEAREALVANLSWYY